MAGVSVIQGGDGMPVEPQWEMIFNDEMDRDLAHDEWGRITREMRESQTLSVDNGNAIKRLVAFRVVHERALRHVGENGAVMPPKNKKEKTGNWNPFWSVMRQSDESIRALEAELGIAPARRSRAGKVQRRAKVARAADNYIKPVNG